MISARADAATINANIRTLRSIDRRIANELRRELRGKIQPYADAIANAVPAQPQLRGMRHDGATRWAGKPKASVSLTPGRSRSGNRLLAIKLTGGGAGGSGLGFDYAEVAGIRNRPPKPFSKVYERGGFPGLQHRVNGQGDAMIAKLRRANPIRGKAGYFAFNEALQKYALLEKIGFLAIRQFSQRLIQELTVRGR